MKRLRILAGICCLSLVAFSQRTMTLPEMFATADSLNATVRAADFAAEAAQAGVDEAKSAYLPSIKASANVSWIGLGYSFDRNFKNAANEQLPNFGNNLALEASQVVFAGGAIRNGVKAAELGSELAVVQARSHRNEVRYLIVGTSLEITKLQNQLQAVQSNIDLTQKVLDQMRSRYQAGTVLQSDISRYELMLKNLEFGKIDLTGAIDIMSSKLSDALGLPAGESVVPQMELDLPPREVACDTGNSPAVSSASLAADLSEAQVRIARAERLPSLALFAGDSFNGPDVTTFIAGKMAGNGLLDKNFNFATVGIGVTYQLDNLYKSGRKIRRTEAASQQAQAQLEAARQGVGLALIAAQTEYRNSFEHLDISKQALELAVTFYEQVSARYDGGLATITDLLDASSSKLESEIAAINARIDVLAAYYKLLYICATI